MPIASSPCVILSRHIFVVPSSDQIQSQASFGLVASRSSKIHAKRELLIQINAVSRRLGAAAGLIGMLGRVETDEPVHLATIAYRHQIT
jgi:hypothetical protein